MPPATTSQQALGNLQSAQAAQKSPDQVYQQESSTLGLPAAQQQVSGLRGAINNTTSLLQRVVPSVMGRTSNSLVTSAQADKQVANEQAPLNTQLGQEQQDYSGASSDYNNLLSQVGTLTGNALSGQQNQLSYLQNVYGDLSQSEQQAVTNQLARDQLNAQVAASKASAASSAGSAPTLVGGNSGSGNSGAMTRNAVGGYAFTGAGGVPVTMAQYLAGNGYSSATQIANAAAQLLAASGSSSDKAIATAISSGKFTPQQLAQKYPQVFGGSF